MDKKRDGIGMERRGSTRLAVIAGSLLFCTTALRAAEPATPLEVYGRLPTLEDLVLSPDGTRLASVETNGDERNLYIRRLNDGAVLGAAHIKAVKARSLDWVDNDNLMIEISSTSPPPIGFEGPLQEWYELYGFNVPKRKLTPVTFSVPGERTFNVVSASTMPREIGGATVLFVPGLYVGTEQALPALFRYDVAGNHMRLIAKGSEPDTDWAVDESGRVAGEFVYRERSKQWQLKIHSTDRSRVAASGDAPIDVPSVVGFSAKGDSLLMRFVENGQSLLKPISLRDGSWGEPLAKGETFDVAIEDRKTGRIIGGVRDGHCVFFDNEMQAHWDATLRGFPGEFVELTSYADDFSRILVRVFGVNDGYVYAIFDWYSHKTVIMGKVYQGLTGVAEVQEIDYPAADGLKIPAFLTLPPGRPAKDLPLVVLPHGGPAAADDYDFDWWAQALASRGYAVLQPNYRGSNLNREYLVKGFGQWGRKMQTDLSDGIDYLAKSGSIDPKRVCIVGASYGGYAALAGITLQPGVYRCAASVAGVADLKRFLQWSSEGRGDSRAQRYWDRFMGVSGPGDPALQAISPIEHVGAVAGPILLVHGKDDTVVPYEQSELMAAALKRAGRRVDLVTLMHEDHWLSRSETRLQMLQAAVAFLEANNPPD